MGDIEENPEKEGHHAYVHVPHHAIRRYPTPTHVDI
jgi:hypothetical protein